MKLHLGCGKRFIPGYKHVDVIHYDHIDYLCSVDHLPVFADNSVDVIYTCHVLEHFNRMRVPQVLSEWYRVLKPGGVLRVSVPDFAALAELYRQTEDLSLVLGPLFGRQDYLYNIHYMTFDFTTLRAALETARFKDVARYDWRQTEHAHVDDYSQAYYPHMDKDNGMLLSLNVEARK